MARDRQSALRAAKTARRADDDTLGPNYPVDYLQCRDLRHAWKLVGYYRANGHIVRALVCERCDMDRHDRLWSSGRLAGRTYTPPEGYYVPGGVELVDVRAELMDRFTIFESEDDMVKDKEK